jgi:hypothetical protein
MRLDPEPARQFLKALYGSYFSQANGTAYLEVRGKREGEELEFRRFYRTPVALVRGMRSWPPDQNFWIGVAPRKDNQSGRKENCKALTAAFADVDVGTAGHRGIAKYQTKEAALSAIEAFPLRPSILNDSGGGYQSHWLLKEPVELTDGNLARMERINRGLALALGGDVGATDASRILRLPGTFNLKLAGNPRPVKTVWCEPERLYDLADFTEYEAQGKAQAQAPGETGKSGNGDYEAYAHKALADELAKLARTPAHDPGRNNQLNKAAFSLGQLVGAGILDRGSVEAALSGTAAAIGLGAAEIQTTIKSGIEAGMKEPRELPETTTRRGSADGQGATPKPLSITPSIPYWPQEVMTGASGAFARCYASYLETPEPFLFMNYLTLMGHVISDKITLASEIPPQPRLYTVNLGKSAITRKSTSINKPVRFFLDTIAREDVNLIWGVGSAEGLQNAFDKHHRGILVQDELKALVQKMKIDGSVLLPCINTLFELNCYENLTRNRKVTIEAAELCLLAASTLETYQNMFTSQFLDIGFLNRLFIVIGSSERRFAVPPAVPEHEKETLKKDLREVLKFVGNISQTGRYALPLTSDARDIFEAWYFDLEQSDFASRLDTYGHRLMILLAVNEMQATITAEITKKVVALLNYQLAARKYANPIDADNAIAKVEERIRRALTPGPLYKRDLERRINKGRVGIWAWEAAIKNLRNAGEISWDSKTGVFRLND